MDLGEHFVAKLEPYLLLSKSSKGAGAAKLIQEVTAAPGVYVFSELLDMPNIQELSASPTHSQFYSLLQLFAYKTYMDYVQYKDSLPPLTPAQTLKLKHLTLVSLSMDKRILPYSQLLELLDMQSVRDLEDLIIEAIYQDVIRGKLDQKDNQFEVEYTMGRDVEPGKIETMLTALQNWASTTAAVLSTLDEKLGILSKQAAHDKSTKDAHERLYQANLQEVYEKQREAKVAAVRPAGAPQLKSGPTAAGMALMEKEREKERQREQQEKEREQGESGGGENGMDVDDTADAQKGKNKKAPLQDSKSRKRNRF